MGQRLPRKSRDAASLPDLLTSRKMASGSSNPPADDPNLRMLRRLTVLVAFIVFAIILTFCYFASEFAISIVISAILAIVVDPLVHKLGRAHLSRPAASGLVVIFGCLIVLAIAFGLFRQASNFVEELPRYSQQIHREFSPILKKFYAGEGKQGLGMGQISNLGSYLQTQLGSVRTLLVVAGVTPFLVFFMLARKEQMYFRVIELLEGTLDTNALVNNLNRVLRAVAYGYLVAGSVMAAVCCAEFALLHVHGALVVGIICGYINLVPYVGAIIAIILALAGALLRFSSIAPILTIVLTILGLHFVFANFVAPKWIGPRVQIGPAATIASMLFWGWLWGILGIVLAIPLTASLKVVADLHPGLSHFSDLLADNLHLVERDGKIIRKKETLKRGKNDRPCPPEQ